MKIDFWTMSRSNKYRSKESQVHNIQLRQTNYHNVSAVSFVDHSRWCIKFNDCQIITQISWSITNGRRDANQLQRNTINDHSQCLLIRWCVFVCSHLLQFIGIFHLNDAKNYIYRVSMQINSVLKNMSGNQFHVFIIKETKMFSSLKCVTLPFV